MATAATRTGQFDLRHDLDYFRVTLVAGQRYVFTMNGSGANPVTVNQLQLFTPSSAVQSYLWETYDLQPTSGGGSVISYVARESGTFYLLAQLPAGQTIAQTGVFNDTGSYTVSANSVALDDHSDIPASGTALAIGSSLAGVFDLRHDLDHFKLTLTGGQRYLFTMNGSGAQAVESSSLDVLDANGESVVNDTYATSDGGAKIAFVAPTSGTYSLLATKPTSYFLTTPVDTGSYTVAASSVALDDHSDLPALGTVLGVGATLAGAFDLRHDLDYFKATLVAGQRYLFKMNGGGGAAVRSSDLELLDPQGLSVVSDSQSTANGGAMFSFVAPSSGTYSLLSTLALGAAGGSGDTGTYTVNLTSVALDDHSDLPVTGTVLNVGGSLGGQVDLRMDLDYFRISLTAGQRVYFQMQAAGATPINTADVRLKDPQGEFAGIDVSIGLDFGFSIPGFPLSTPAHAKFVMTAATTGTYTLLAQQGSGYIALGSGAATIKDQGSYTVSATAVPLDDHSDIMTLGTPLAVGATLNGAFDYRHDFDFFKATLTAGQRYLIKMVGTTAGSPTDTTAFNITVFEGQGLSAQTDAATTHQGGAIIAYVAPVSGTYYLLAQLVTDGGITGSSDTASYRLSLESIALDDHSDLRQTGTVLFTDTPAANVAPVAANGNATTNEDTALTANLPAATDANGDAITYAKTSNPSKGSVTVNANGSYSYTPSANANGSDTFSFSVSDGQGASNSYTQTINITPVNDAPQKLVFAPGLSAIVGQPFSYTIAVGNFVDPDGDVLTYTVTLSGGAALPAWLSFNNATRTLSGTPTAANVGNIEIRLRASDGSLFVDDFAPMNVSQAANVNPVSANGSATVLEDTVLTANLPAASDANGDPIAYTKTSNPSKGAVVVNANGSYTYTPNSNANGSDAFVFSVSDGRGGSNSYTQTITITPVNDAPVGGVSITGTVELGQRLGTFNTLTDADGLGALSYQWLRAGVAIVGATASSYVLSLADVGAAISVRASYTDGGGTTESVLSTATVAVPAVNVITGTVGNDSLTGTAGVDAIRGLDGNDTLSGVAGNDSLEGGTGKDVLLGGAGNDTLDGGAGVDVADYRSASAVNVNLQSGVTTQGSDSDTLIAIEAIFGSSAADTLRGLDGGANLPGETVRGGGGNDSIDGGAGIDMAEFNGLLSAYTLTRTPGTLNVSVAHNAGGADGTDALSNVELLLFADRVVGFGPRVEEVARVAFALWSPAIYNAPTLFSKGLSFYTNEFGYSFDTLCQVALQYHPEVGLALATKLVGNAPGTTLTAAGLLTLMNANGGGDSATGRAAAVKAVALDAATTDQLDVMGVLTKGIVATLNFDADVYFGPLPG